MKKISRNHQWKSDIIKYIIINFYARKQMRAMIERILDHPSTVTDVPVLRLAFVDSRIITFYFHIPT